MIRITARCPNPEDRMDRNPTTTHLATSRFRRAGEERGGAPSRMAATSPFLPTRRERRSILSLILNRSIRPATV
ncbi:MAG TPA: hypothetical protein VFY18_09695 [Candidatus Limnocylindrales bacterium]|nr:hypothetical protein [Candidatus Limnocylindrales bacterium]